MSAAAAAAAAAFNGNAAAAAAAAAAGFPGRLGGGELLLYYVYMYTIGEFPTTIKAPTILVKYACSAFAIENGSTAPLRKKWEKLPVGNP